MTQIFLLALFGCAFEFGLSFLRSLVETIKTLARNCVFEQIEQLSLVVLDNALNHRARIIKERIEVRQSGAACFTRRA